jgi:hypothetical protein
VKQKKLIFLVIIFTILLFTNVNAQSPEGKNFGFGVMVGDPTGGTLKFFTDKDNAFVIDFGASYFGSPRIGMDYLWQFNPFRSNIANLYAGAGAALGLGKGEGIYYKNRLIRENNNTGIGVRGVFGVNVIPPRTPLEIFLEFGVLVALAPHSDSFADIGLGMRFYP